MLILHYTGMRTAAEALDRLRDPSARVSAHYLVDEDGTVVRLVPEERRAWHAGVACWRGWRDINDRSLGIELVNPGHEHGYRPFPPAQMTALVALASRLVRVHAIPPRHVLGHADVAPSRKLDPGELFDWRGLAAAGVGLWPLARPVAGETGLTLRPGDMGALVHDFRRALVDFGYDLGGDSSGFDEATAAAVRAFQRHFRPARVDGAADPETIQLLHAVLALCA
jgi:N-acetylmuramoyl-L-alanine amidase